jgi:hypothetical protein
MQGLLRVSGGSVGATPSLAEGEQQQNGALQMAGGEAGQAGRAGRGRQGLSAYEQGVAVEQHSRATC